MKNNSFLGLFMICVIVIVTFIVFISAVIIFFRIQESSISYLQMMDFIHKGSL